MFEVEITHKFEVEKQHIRDLLITALEGGSNYWINEVKVLEPEKFDESNQAQIIAAGGMIVIVDEDDEPHVLTRDLFLSGIKQYLSSCADSYRDMDDFVDSHDAGIADSVLQFAIFNEVIFG